MCTITYRRQKSEMDLGFLIRVAVKRGGVGAVTWAPSWGGALTSVGWSAYAVTQVVGVSGHWSC